MTKLYEQLSNNQKNAISKFVWDCRIECTLKSPTMSGFKLTNSVLEYARTGNYTPEEIQILEDRLARDLA